MKFVCFDLEGPLSPEDNAYELMKLVPNGQRVFEALSKYDDLLTLEGRTGYEPGDTLALIVPFLICHGLTEATIHHLAGKARLVDGAQELIATLRSRAWNIFCISTSYQQYAHRICQRIGIDSQDIAATEFPLDEYSAELVGTSSAMVEHLEKEIIDLSDAGDDDTIRQRLDRFYWQDLPPTKLGQALREVKPVGGRRKVEAMVRFAARCGGTPGDAVVVGDSITDFKMLQAVDQAGGLAVAFNANEYALPYAAVGLASTNLTDLASLLQAWEEGGMAAVEAVARQMEQGGAESDRRMVHWLRGGDVLSRALAAHRRIRRLVRQEAAQLG